MNPRIPRFDYRQQFHSLRHEILQAIESVLESGSLILGPCVARFEAAMCEMLGGGHAVGVGNGTDAIAIALRALHVSAGDEVITVANTAVATISAIGMVGAKPVFCDINPDTLQMDPEQIERRINPRTRAIIPVHLYGNAADMAAITRIASLYGLYVIEDCAQACGTLLHGRPSGTWGDIGCFSFYPTKNLGAYGDGGLCYTRKRELANAMRQIRSYGCAAGANALREGVNSRLDELQAAILDVKLKHLAHWVRERQRVAEVYRAHLPASCRVPSATDGAQQSYHLFVIETDCREQIAAGLRTAGIETTVHYPVPVHLMEAYQHLGYASGSLPNTERAAARVLSLPCYPELPDEAVIEVCGVIRSIA
jgi:dTDP-4-amino-4,6-dideoxygalactose transaminase